MPGNNGYIHLVKGLHKYNFFCGTMNKQKLQADSYSVVDLSGQAN